MSDTIVVQLLLALIAGCLLLATFEGWGAL